MAGRMRNRGRRAKHLALEKLQKKLLYLKGNAVKSGAKKKKSGQSCSVKKKTSVSYSCEKCGHCLSNKRSISHHKLLHEKYPELFCEQDLNKRGGGGGGGEEGDGLIAKHSLPAKRATKPMFGSDRSISPPRCALSQKKLAASSGTVFINGIRKTNQESTTRPKKKVTNKESVISPRKDESTCPSQTSRQESNATQNSRRISTQPGSGHSPGMAGGRSVNAPENVHAPVSNRAIVPQYHRPIDHRPFMPNTGMGCGMHHCNYCGWQCNFAPQNVGIVPPTINPIALNHAAVQTYYFPLMQIPGGFYMHFF